MVLSAVVLPVIFEWYCWHQRYYSIIVIKVIDVSGYRLGAVIVVDVTTVAVDVIGDVSATMWVL